MQKWNRYFDPETDLAENWNRYYDPGIGRYLEPEPALQNPRYPELIAKASVITQIRPVVISAKAAS